MLSRKTLEKECLESLEKIGQNDPDGLYRLFLFLEKGNDESKLKAFKVLDRLIELNYPQAYMKVVMYNYFGIGTHVPPNLDNAWDSISTAVMLKIKEAIYQMGLFAQQGAMCHENVEYSQRCFAKAGEMGHLDAEYRSLKYKYLFQHMIVGSATNSTVIEKLKVLFDKGHDESGLILLQFYSDDKAFPSNRQNNRRLERYAKRCIDSRTPYISIMGTFFMTQTFKGYKKNLKTMECIFESAEKHSDDARGLFTIYMVGSQTNQMSVFPILMKSANKGYPLAMVFAAIFLLLEIDEEIYNPRKGMLLLELAAKKYYPLAMYCLAICLESGLHTKKDRNYAIDLYSESYLRGYMASARRLKALNVDIPKKKGKYIPDLFDVD